MRVIESVASLTHPTSTHHKHPNDQNSDASANSDAQQQPPQQPQQPVPEGAYYRVPGLQSVLEAAYYGAGREQQQPQHKATAAAAPATAKRAPLPTDMPEATAAAALVAAGDVESPFGPIAPKPYMKERALDFRTYLLFALAGAVGCAGTHTLVVPLDVVKTRKQTDKANKKKAAAAAAVASQEGGGMVEGVRRLWADEGWDGLFRGVEPTVLGYLFYGVTVRLYGRLVGWVDHSRQPKAHRSNP